jgi:hypothetical protein
MSDGDGKKRTIERNCMDVEYTCGIENSSGAGPLSRRRSPALRRRADAVHRW